MNNRKSIFRFKKFECSHARSAMKIGVDAVILGAWVDLSNVNSALDVGTGCGVIALMCAQRNSEAIIMGIDIDLPSIEEATDNFRNSPWSNRLSTQLIGYENYIMPKVDLIISNPPYFNSGIAKPDTSRLKARHDSSLSPVRLLSKAPEILRQGGRVAMVIPSDRYDDVIAAASNCYFTLTRGCRVKGHANAPFKRLLLEFSLIEGEFTQNNEVEWEELVLELCPGQRTSHYQKLCEEFYIK